jgi:hypothetical protein
MDPYRASNGTEILKGTLGTYYLYSDCLMLQPPEAEWFVIKDQLELMGWR